jgi:hypothetical protein
MCENHTYITMRGSLLTLRLSHYLIKWVIGCCLKHQMNVFFYLFHGRNKLLLIMSAATRPTRLMGYFELPHSNEVH